MTAQGPEEGAKRAGAENDPRTPWGEQPEDGEEEKEVQVGEHANGAPERAKTAAINQGGGKKANSRKAQEEEDPKGHQRRPGKKTGPLIEGKEKEAMERMLGKSTNVKKYQVGYGTFSLGKSTILVLFPIGTFSYIIGKSTIQL